jgi:hypothetical protein
MSQPRKKRATKIRASDVDPQHKYYLWLTSYLAKAGQNERVKHIANRTSPFVAPRESGVGAFSLTNIMLSLGLPNLRPPNNNASMHRRTQMPGRPASITLTAP